MIRPVLAITLIASVQAALAAQAPRLAATDPLREHYQSAQTFQLAGDLERAEIEYSREVIPRALRRLAALTSAEGRHDEARRQLESALEHQPGDVDLTLDLAVVRLRAREFEPARRLALQSVTSAPRHPRAARLYGRILLIVGDPSTALTELERAMTLASDADTTFTLGYALLRAKRPDDARVLFDRLIASSTSPEAAIRIGRAYLETGFVDAAIGQFTNALRRDASRAEIHYYLGLARIKQPGAAHVAEAGAALEAALKIDAAHEPSMRLLRDLKAGRRVDLDSGDSVLLQDPPGPDEERGARIRTQLVDVLGNSYFNLGVVYSRRQRAADAAVAMARAAEWKPDLEGIDRALGVSLFYADRFADAIGPLERHMAAHPDDGAGRKLLETSYLMAGRSRASTSIGSSLKASTETAVSLDLDAIGAEVSAGHGAAAEQQLWQVLARDPANIRALDLLGQVLLSAARGAEAEAVFRRATTVERANAATWLGLSRALRAQNRLEEAKDALVEGLAHRPTDPALEYELARTFLDLNDATSALEHLARVPEGSRPSGNLALEFAAHLTLNHTEQVKALLSRAEADADAPTAEAIAALLLERSRPADVNRLVNAVRARGQVTAPLLVVGGRARGLSGDSAQAERWFEEALMLDPTHTRALTALGESLFARGEAERATDLLLKARTLGDTSADLLRALALAAAGALRFDVATDTAIRLTAVRPNDPEAFNLLGTIQLQAGDWTAAELTFERLATLSPAESRAALGLGIARFGQRRLDDAAAAFEKSLALNSGVGEAHYQLALIAREEGRSTDAISRLERALALAPNHQAAHTTLGSLLVLAGDYQRARQVLERAVSLGPESPDPHYQLGLLYGRLGDADRAKREMEQFWRLRNARGTKPTP